MILESNSQVLCSKSLNEFWSGNESINLPLNSGCVGLKIYQIDNEETKKIYVETKEEQNYLWKFKSYFKFFLTIFPISHPKINSQRVNEPFKSFKANRIEVEAIFEYNKELRYSTLYCKAKIRGLHMYSFLFFILEYPHILCLKIVEDFLQSICLYFGVKDSFRNMA